MLWEGDGASASSLFFHELNKIATRAWGLSVMPIHQSSMWLFFTSGVVAQLAEHRIVYPKVAGSNPVILATVVVAQLVEHWVVIPNVAGSSPVNHPI